MSACIVSAHLRQRAAAEAGQPAEELVRTLLAHAGHPRPPMATVRLWLWARAQLALLIEGELSGATTHECILCVAPKAVFVDGGFGAYLRSIKGGWEGARVGGSTTELERAEAALAGFDLVVAGATLDGAMSGSSCGEWTAAAEVGGQ